ncbi:hypothetical protein RHSIM_Rhsim01G0019400 [Rhododendron simsii]|uniref:PB1-like domain-containing protein n=1 Tax=Rhododendron simsii TaxID=118357 RepID=A0A834HE65_RHOSS|nr:hypothetical protein RHSIM_Rhsim01G0019400 [Rhododendron simsii]
MIMHCGPQSPPCLHVVDHGNFYAYMTEKNDAVHFSIKMHYDGKLVIGINTRRYVGGKVAFFDWVDTDYMGMIELKDMVKELNLFGSMTYHYKVPARDLYHGFRHLEDDSDCIEMVKWVKLSKTIEVYLENHCSFSNENQHLSDDTTDLEEFIDSEADEREDDRLFDIHVDKYVEWGGLSMGKGKEPMSANANDNEDSDAEGQSDELTLLYPWYYYNHSNKNGIDKSGVDKVVLSGLGSATSWEKDMTVNKLFIMLAVVSLAGSVLTLVCLYRANGQYGGYSFISGEVY